MSEKILATLPLGHSSWFGSKASLLARQALAPRVLVSLAALALLTGCSGAGKANAQPNLPHCVQVLADSQIAGHSAVGAFACLSPSVQDASRAEGVASDADIADVANQPPVFTHDHYLGHALHGYYFQYSGDNGEAGCWRFRPDSNGLIDGLGYHEGACPSPLS